MVVECLFSSFRLNGEVLRTVSVKQARKSLKKIVLFSLNRRRSAVHKRGKLVVSVHSFYCLPAKTFTVYVALVLCWSGYK